MKSGWAIVIAASMTAFAAGPAASQSPWPQPPQQAAAPWPGEQPQQQAQPQAGPSPWDQKAPPPQAAPQAWPAPQQQPPQQAGPDPWSGQQQQPQQDPRNAQCLEGFVKLRKEVEKHGSAIQAAGQRKEKPSPKVACGLFKTFTAAEQKMYVYAAKNHATCGIPPQIIDNLKQARAKSDEIRNRVCQVAAQGPAQQRAPSLSDALSAPVPDSANIKTGRGTFDTLTGNALGK